MNLPHGVWLHRSPPDIIPRELERGSMARTPCFRCGERFGGDAHNVYWTYYDGDDSAKLRYIVCKGCVEDMASDWIGKALHRGADNRWHDPEDDETLQSILRASGDTPVAIRWQKVS